MSKNSGSSSSGIGISGVLFIVFLVLKLVGVISWSWWWVCAPLWISVGLAIVAILVLAVIEWFENR